MTRYDVNVSMLFADLPFLRRFEAAAAAGFEAVEFLWPSPEQLDGRSVSELGKFIRATGLQVALFNLDAGDLTKGWRGLAGVPDAREAFRANLPVAIDLAVGVGCRKLNALAGNAVSLDSRPAQVDVLVDGLIEAADMAEKEGISIMVEALNPVDFPSYLVTNSIAALEVIARTGRPNVRLQLDVYHLAMARERPVEVVHRAGGRIGHVQFADYPGRHEPGTGTLQWKRILASLADVGYQDWIGLEYQPSDVTSRTFEFLEAIGGSLHRSAFDA